MVTQMIFTRLMPPRNVLSWPPSRKPLGGFTIIELIIVVAIAAILIAIAGPDFRKIIVATRVKNVSFDVFSSLTHARSEAISRNTTVRVCRATSWASGWTVTFAPDCNSSSITAANTIRKQDAYQGVTIADSPSSSSVSFNGMGRASTQVSFSIDAPGINTKDKRCVVIDPSGRSRTQEGACS